MEWRSGYMEVPLPRWMVIQIENPTEIWMMTFLGTPSLGNLYIYIYMYIIMIIVIILCVLVIYIYNIYVYIYIICYVIGSHFTTISLRNHPWHHDISGIKSNDQSSLLSALDAWNNGELDLELWSILVGALEHICGTYIGTHTHIYIYIHFILVIS